MSREPGNLLDLIFRDPVTQVLNDTGSEPLLFENNIRSTLDDYFDGNYSDTWNRTLVSAMSKFLHLSGNSVLLFEVMDRDLNSRLE